mmetsp:Transcript_8325/g.9690  ORF Transcript_8325/g.9690 Transcript_8325/m.9690 type:complete len:251 (-) Transcript_8325:102-854(-)|eukprot:CAMPEP_0197864114 /NCGR_PEP_ID=MMETSP1438-20131217/42090_1 /TAXON_ID=1461541 /ORGANISM="Pterosperma sp., Strain CCMP1384" /LENGTH=250 /DNA_ID=CAMNT_0043482237 /DNA_START=78 /DNA_END=830 /DNA_ORIENTATION=+
MSTFKELKERGNAFFTRKQFDQAVVWYNKAIEASPKEHAVYTNRSAAYFGLDKYQESLSDAMKAVEINSDWTKGYYRMGMAYMKLGKYREAKAAYQSGLKTDPKNDMILQALKTAEEEILKRPSDHNEAKAKGNACYKESQYDEAAKWYTTALEMAPDSETDFKAICYTNRAECRRQTAVDELCIDDCSQALELQPANVKALTRRGLSYERLDKVKLAMADYKKIKELDPSNMQASQGITRCQKALNAMS